MTESRVDRLLRLAEEAAVDGDYDKTTALLDVLRPAIYLRNREAKDLAKMAKITVDHD